MTVFASGQPAASLDGIPYATAAALPGAEGDLFNLSSPPFFDPVPVVYDCGILAIVQLTANNNPSSNSAYVILQTDLGDGVWVDVAWCIWTGTSGTVTFVLSGGVAGANSFQQSRATGTAPSSNSSNQMLLGGRIRFVGKATIGANASSSSGQAGTSVTATIKYKLLGLR